MGREERCHTDIAERIVEELNSKTAFVIPLFGGIPVGESVVVTWIIMAALVIGSMILVRGLRVENVSRKQLALESFIGFLHDFFGDLLGEEGAGYIPYLITVAIFIGVANLIGLLGFTPPTKDINVTAGLAICSIAVIEYSGLHKKGLKKWLKSFTEPIALITPINILEIFIRPVSLCMRLFGNVLGAFVVMELIKIVLPVGLPVPFSLYFDIFDGLIQAYVFVFLTSLFIKEAVE
ncbi:MAG TPA: F0F1 ATP synthase subunit A [Candidatus Lachnoclostridium pullistercoris]|uniref:ATP synthase subunit a n=1 Tax=Candidatus Lachnoclostridium pullistercoris TaxID=2838632 RepID=A0A9D2PF16_9FIRM|nr:F0F1 ATP synthase subunit A [Candidatus Lachnoclostridium pullistercoris]